MELLEVEASVVESSEVMRLCKEWDGEPSKVEVGVDEREVMERRYLELSSGA